MHATLNKCITRLIVTGTRHYYAGWAWYCTNFVHSTGTIVANCSKTPQFLPVMCALCPRCAHTPPFSVIFMPVFD